LTLALALTGAALGAPRAARAQLSPGPLAEPHRAYEGTTQCLRCHAPRGKGSMDDRCLACHTEIDWLKARGRGLHARDAKGACATCHPDHAGRDFALVRWEEGSAGRFDHARAGWTLAGKHATLACADCHQPKHQRSGGAALIRKQDRARSWLGLETACASCHADPHRAQLGIDCAACHDERAWKPAPRFDHARTEYPLTGEHATLACEKCHLAPALATARGPKGEPLAQWKPLPHRDCTPCHADPHAGRFPKACATCHRTSGWTTIDPRGFDHDRTRYPLRGRHAEVACEKCHDPKTAWGPKPRFAACGNCHRDAHAGKATLAGKPADCAACHRVEGYDRPVYTVAMHAASAYPLEGRHATTPCVRCHTQGPAGSEARLGTARVLLRPASAACTDCHHDPHGGRYAAGSAHARTAGCRACHTLSAFRPSAMDVAQHATTPFPLEGAHRAVPCVACHAELKAAPAASTLAAEAKGARPLRFAESRKACVECHADPHGGQFAGRKRGAACETCHSSERFRPADRFDHDRDTGFKLEGAHARVACEACHRAETRGRARVVRYTGTPTACEACHAPGRVTPGKSSSSRSERPDRAVATLFTTREARHAATVQ
jgi:hypothetical protein